MDTETRPRMTVADIALYREILAWCRNHGVAPWHFSWGHVWRTAGQGDEPEVTWTRGDVHLGVTRNDTEIYSWHRVHSFREAVDLIVALGYLPARFSSAYQAGWHAAQVWFAGDPDDPADTALHRSLFHDPLNVSFPAGES